MTMAMDADIVRTASCRTSWSVCIANCASDIVASNTVVLEHPKVARVCSQISTGLWRRCSEIIKYGLPDYSNADAGLDATDGRSDARDSIPSVPTVPEVNSNYIWDVMRYNAFAMVSVGCTDLDAATGPDGPTSW